MVPEMLTLAHADNIHFNLHRLIKLVYLKNINDWKPEKHCNRIEEAS